MTAPTPLLNLDVMVESQVTSSNSLRIDERGASFGSDNAITISLPPIPILLKTVIRPYDKSDEGKLVRAVAIP